MVKEVNGGSNASYAIRFAASFPNMAMVLSGMSDMAQMEDNLSAMRDFRPLDETELEAVRHLPRSESGALHGLPLLRGGKRVPQRHPYPGYVRLSQCP